RSEMCTEQPPPKLVRPTWWLAYAGLVSALGLAFLISTPRVSELRLESLISKPQHILQLLPLLTVAFLAIAIGAFGFCPSRRNGSGPLWLGLVAASVILTGKSFSFLVNSIAKHHPPPSAHLQHHMFRFDAAQWTYTGVGLLIATSVWNSWPRRHALDKPDIRS